jgi:hypothetical protein
MRRCDFGYSTCARILLLVALFLGSSSGFALEVGQIDEFDTDVSDWIHGTVSPNPPIRIPGGGPGGESDAFLQIRSTAPFGAGSRFAALNRVQWTGDYLSVGATSIRASVKHLGGPALNLRVGFEFQVGFLRTRFVSTDAIPVAVGADWATIEFPIGEADLTRTAGTESFQTVMSGNGELRIVSATTASHLGAIINATLGIDDIELVSVPLPEFRRGDATDDGVVDIADAVLTLRRLFLREGDLLCFDAADSNDDGGLDVADPLATLFAVFVGTPPLPGPGPTDCGADSTGDALGCDVSTSCPAGI